jgi:predicted nuclease of predicted toxin-antitoxin system
MKGYLFDANLPARLLFSPKLPIVPASKAGRQPTDSQIWEFARKQDLVIVSKDAIFRTGSAHRSHSHWTRTDTQPPIF